MQHNEIGLSPKQVFAAAALRKARARSTRESISDLRGRSSGDRVTTPMCGRYRTHHNILSALPLSAVPGGPRVEDIIHRMGGICRPIFDASNA